jgi:hypothetical protein
MNQGELRFDNVETAAFRRAETYHELAYHVLCRRIRTSPCARSASRVRRSNTPCPRPARAGDHLHRATGCSRCSAKFKRHTPGLHDHTTRPRRAGHRLDRRQVTTADSFRVASEAMQLFGGNGVTRAYPLEKLLRDARASMIADGANEMLAIRGAGSLIDPSRLRQSATGGD